jgi:hypothetical protein
MWSQWSNKSKNSESILESPAEPRSLVRNAGRRAASTQPSTLFLLRIAEGRHPHSRHRQLSSTFCGPSAQTRPRTANRTCKRGCGFTDERACALHAPNLRHHPAALNCHRESGQESRNAAEPTQTEGGNEAAVADETVPQPRQAPVAVDAGRQTSVMACR